jgi:hypothetical protein
MHEPAADFASHRLWSELHQRNFIRNSVSLQWEVLNHFQQQGGYRKVDIERP